MMAKYLRLLLLLIATLPLALAQNRANFPWWNSPVRADLGLSPAQNRKIQQIVRSYRPRLLDARNEVQKAEGDLEDILNDAEPNPQAAHAVIERVTTARANSSRVFLQMSVELRNVLTFDQWRLLVRRWDEVKNKRPADTQVTPE